MPFTNTSTVQDAPTASSAPESEMAVPPSGAVNASAAPEVEVQVVAAGKVPLFTITRPEGSVSAKWASVRGTAVEPPTPGVGVELVEGHPEGAGVILVGRGLRGWVGGGGGRG